MEKEKRKAETNTEKLKKVQNKKSAKYKVKARQKQNVMARR
jgi:hypothetical protein